LSVTVTVTCSRDFAKPQVLWFLERQLSLVSYYRGADKSSARPTSRCILFDGEDISFYANLAIYKNSTNIHPIMIINRIYEHQNLPTLYLVSFLVGTRTYQHPCKQNAVCLDSVGRVL
jgi:hypothetical protein